MFDKIMGTDRVGKWLEERLSPQEIESLYAAELEEFKTNRQEYLIYGYAGKPGHVGVTLDNVASFSTQSRMLMRTAAPWCRETISERLGRSLDGMKPLGPSPSQDSVTISLKIGSSTATVKRRGTMDGYGPRHQGRPDDGAREVRKQLPGGQR